MIIDKVTLSQHTEVNIDAEGIRIKQRGDNTTTFLTFNQLRDINALVDALGRQAHYQALVDHYSTPLFGETP